VIGYILKYISAIVFSQDSHLKCFFLKHFYKSYLNVEKLNQGPILALSVKPGLKYCFYLINVPKYCIYLFDLCNQIKKISNLYCKNST